MTVAGSSLPNTSQFSTDIETFKRILNASYQLGEQASKRNAPKHRSRSSQIYRPRMDMLDDPASTAYRALLELPGLKADEIKLQIRQNHLCVYGERRSRMSPVSAVEEVDREMSPMTRSPFQEIRYGRFYRAIRLPPGSDPMLIKASMVDGMLTIDFPRASKSSKAESPRSSPPHTPSTTV